MRALSAEQFAEYARRQIAAADGILARHGRTGALCRCARQWPCPVAVTCVKMREHYVARLALAEATVRLPMVHAGRKRRVSAWRRVLTALERAVRS
ncbi:hypothetical protein [Catellatospora sp. NPDC049609]|uniref:hypothetical protein n=1 Tax=Catellatospora sp. NPDC049609 TaxID=3155505 RepID=UPI0034359FAA